MRVACQQVVKVPDPVVWVGGHAQDTRGILLFPQFQSVTVFSKRTGSLRPVSRISHLSGIPLFPVYLALLNL